MALADRALARCCLGVTTEARRNGAKGCGSIGAECLASPRPNAPSNFIAVGQSLPCAQHLARVGGRRRNTPASNCTSPPLSLAIREKTPARQSVGGIELTEEPSQRDGRPAAEEVRRPHPGKAQHAGGGHAPLAQVSESDRMRCFTP